jgi:hypothetical protein
LVRLHDSEIAVVMLPLEKENASPLVGSGRETTGRSAGTLATNAASWRPQLAGGVPTAAHLILLFSKVTASRCPAGTHAMAATAAGYHIA